ncbi:hypothetical protein [Rubinisphaera margarita]|uniref:hypothetical protein n=1 Tax=Rubinisphaera margarita TaxID=2909586 RepID=UPI001EE94F12|nr:hypothetical protein [Rubinisphaera margarita]MCG6158095.1 hypothetical protein [Rubinisphaera margarita]
MSEQDTDLCRGMKVVSADAGPDFLILHLDGGCMLRVFCDGEWVQWEIVRPGDHIGFQGEEEWNVESVRHGDVVTYEFPRKELVDRAVGRSVVMLTVMVKCLFVAFDQFQYMFNSRFCVTDGKYVLLYHEENE